MYVGYGNPKGLFMKFMKFAKFVRLAWLPLVLEGFTACYDSGFGEPQDIDRTEPVTLSIAQLKKQFLGTPFVIDGDFSVTGYVTSSDRAGNFYRTICIEENQSAIELMAGIDQLHNDFPVGCSVTLHLDGLTVAERLGVLQIGNAPEPGSGYDTDYIASKAALDKILFRNSEKIREVVPAHRSIPELTPELCGSLVRIDNLRYVSEEVDEGEGLNGEMTEEVGEACWSGYGQFIDPEGNTIYSYVRSYADFATEAIPQGEVSLVGILQYENSANGRYLIKLRDENDCLP